MSELIGGGPAFPQKEPVMSDWEGMTLRDYFAAKAMQAYLMPAGPCHTLAQPEDFDHFAEMAYLSADAMLRARTK